MYNDLRYAIRQLLKNPGFTVVAVLTLALGIGANTTIFSFVNAILLRPLPYKNAEQLVVPISFNTSRGFDNSSISYADYLDWKEAGIFEYVAALSLLSTADLGGGDSEPERVQVMSVSEDYFDVMRSDAVVGRTFREDEFSPSDLPRGAMISYNL